METNSKAHITVLGMGIIGSRCADNLQSAGMNVRTWNRTPKGRDDEMSSAAEAVKGSETVFFYLNTGETCVDVFESIKPALADTKVIINCSTIDLESTLWLAQACEDAGCSFLDCPFTGSKVAASRGELVYYVGGDEALLEEYQSVLEITAKKIIPIGKVGDATVIKIATNLISASTVQALSESLAITNAQGIPAEKLISAISNNACSSPLASMKLPTMAAGDYETHFSLENMLKDANFALSLAEQAELKTPGIQTTANVIQELSNQGSASLDFSSLYKQFNS